MHTVQLDALCGIAFLNSLNDGLCCEFFRRRPARLRLRWLKYGIREDGKLILILTTLVGVLMAVIMNVETEAFFLAILPIDARLSVALLIRRKIMLVLVILT